MLRRRRRRSKALFEDKKETPAPADIVLSRPDPSDRPPVPPRQFPAYNSPATSSFSAGDSSANFQGSNMNSYAATQGHTPWSSQSQPYTTADLGHSNPNLISATFNPSLRQADSDSALFQTARDQVELPPLSPGARAALGLGQPIDRNRDLRLPLPPRAVRNSFNTTSTFSSELSGDAIMAQSAVRQVLGFTRAEVVHTPKHSMSSVHPSVYPSMHRLSGTPSSLGLLGGGNAHAPPIPSRLGRRSLEPLRNPFNDSRSASPSRPSPDSPTSATNLVQLSPAPTSATFGDTGSPLRKSWAKQSREQVQSSSERGRTPSISTHPGSVVSSSSYEQLVPKHKTSQHLPVPLPQDLPRSPLSAPLSTARSPNVAGPSTGVLEHQQQQAIDKAKARMSVLSSASSVADSLLSTFPFVPPSPVSSKGSYRSDHPRSPLHQQAFTSADDKRQSVSSAYPDTVAPLSPSSPFDTQPTSSGRQRASLDTVALSSDLMNYPLFYDRKDKGKKTQRTNR